MNCFELTVSVYFNKRLSRCYFGTDIGVILFFLKDLNRKATLITNFGSIAIIIKLLLNILTNILIGYC